MRSVRRYARVAGGLSAGLLTLGVAGASAVAPVAAGDFEPELELSQGSGQAGDAFTISGEFCEDDSYSYEPRPTFVQLTLVDAGGTELVEEVDVAPEDEGAWSTEVTIPEGTPPGDLTIDGTCIAVEDDSEPELELHASVGFRSAQSESEQFSYQTASFIVLPPTPTDPGPGEPGPPGPPGPPGETPESPETPEAPETPETPETPSATPVEGSTESFTG